jgi:hypothetical protein
MMNEQTIAKSGAAIDHDKKVVAEVLRALSNIRFGSVEILIHDAKVVQIERKEKMRLDRP